MKILVTGGAGFIGSNISTGLKQEKHNVVIIDNLDPYYQLQLKLHNLKLLKKRKIPFYKIDILNKKRLEKIFICYKPDIVLHLAAKAGVRYSIINPEEYFSINVSGTLNILQLSKHYKVKKVMIASSSSVYGNNTKVPFSENDPVDNQISPYASSKRAMEVLCKMYSETYGLNIQLFRFFTVYGPSGRPDMAPYIFTRSIDQKQPINVFGSLDTERDYTYIDDIVDGLIKAIKIDDKFQIYNLGNNTPVKLGNFIKTIEESLGRKAIIHLCPPQQGDVPRTWADITKAQSAFNYNPHYSITEGVTKFVEWYTQYKSLYQEP